MKVEEIVPDEQLREAFINTDFGNSLARDTLKYSLLKEASGYANGSTATNIMVRLGLIKHNWMIDKNLLTKRGGEYLWAAFSGYENHE